MELTTSSIIEQTRLNIINYIKDYIKENNLKDNDKLPSENALADMFSTNRNTVRSAFTALKGQGIVYSQKGRGFFVSSRPLPLVYEHDNSLGFSEILLKGERNFTSKIISTNLRNPSQKEIEILSLADDELVYCLKQIRRIGNRDLAVCTSILPARIVPNLENNTDNFKGVNNILIGRYNYSHPICKWVKLEACVPNSEDIDLLNIPHHMPMLKQENLFEISNVGPAEYFIVRARGDMFHFSMEFK